MRQRPGSTAVESAIVAAGLVRVRYARSPRRNG